MTPLWVSCDKNIVAKIFFLKNCAREYTLMYDKTLVLKVTKTCNLTPLEGSYDKKMSAKKISSKICTRCRNSEFTVWQDFEKLRDFDFCIFWSFHKNQVFRFFLQVLRNFCGILGLKYSLEYHAYDLIMI